MKSLYAKCFSIAIVIFFITGCPKEKNDRIQKKNQPKQQNVEKTYKVATVGVQSFSETVELPGATVQGIESTNLMAKVGGYVKHIRRIANGLYDGKTVQITETNDLEKGMKDIRILILQKNNGRIARNTISVADKAELDRQNTEASELYQRFPTSEIDIGSMVQAGTVLAILDIPEMQNDLAEKQALVEQAKSFVQQATQAVIKAKAELKQRRAEVEQYRSELKEKDALLSFQNRKYDRISKLFQRGNIDEDNLEEARLQKDAAQAVKESSEAALKTAESKISVADANILQAKAEENISKAKVKVARESLKKLQTMTEYASIKAPFTGIVTNRSVDHGALVKPGTSNSGAKALFEITRIDKVRVVVDVPNSKAAHIQQGLTVVVKNISGLPGKKVTGTVTRTSSILNHKSRMMRIYIDFENPTPKGNITLTPGMFATVSILVNHWNALPVVPTSAIVTGKNGGSTVVVVDSENRCELRNVEISFNDALNVGLRQGIAKGERVVVEGVSNLKKEIEKLKPGKKFTLKTTQ